ncbi:MAG: aminopeptidase, partial [Thioalkalispiraceae bacterium]
MKQRPFIINIVLLLFSSMIFSACSSVGYYSQAISGQLELMSRERPIDEVIRDKSTPKELKRKLELAERARAFAIEQLHLPDNDSYTEYADLERPYVVWNVVATPAYSIQPRQWCFLIVGCLSYRGSFDQRDATEMATALKQQGMDTSVFGTAAYSTLGYFDDPLLNTMLRNGDTSMVGVIFHELAHQTVYVDSDTAFNEAFASAVEQEGLRRWFDKMGTPEQYQDYLLKKQYRHEFFSLITRTRTQLDVVFKTALPDKEKQKRKQEIYARFKNNYKAWSNKRNYHAFDKWMQQDLNNSHLALVATYQDLVPAFLNLLTSVNGDLE